RPDGGLPRPPPRRRRAVSRRAGAAVAAALAAALALAAGCGREGDDDARGATRLPEPEASALAGDRALDEPLMIALAQARNFHHKADLLLEEARVADAIAAVRQVLAVRFPPGAAEG